MTVPGSERRGVVTDATAKDWKWAAEHHKDYGTWAPHAILSLLEQREQMAELLWQTLRYVPAAALFDEIGELLSSIRDEDEVPA